MVDQLVVQKVASMVGMRDVQMAEMKADWKAVCWVDLSGDYLVDCSAASMVAR